MSAARFDQQETTRLHRDGGPDESLLLLGYEPSVVVSEIALADYSCCAFDHGLTPTEFLEKHNPMFRAGEQLLQAYTTKVACFSPDRYQLVVINNSVTALAPDQLAWQGVLHTATIPRPNGAARRVVNSMMLASVAPGTPEVVSQPELDTFLTTAPVRRKGYDKQHLEEDC